MPRGIQNTRGRSGTAPGSAAAGSCSLPPPMQLTASSPTESDGEEPVVSQRSFYMCFAQFSVKTQIANLGARPVGDFNLQMTRS